LIIERYERRLKDAAWAATSLLSAALLTVASGCGGSDLPLVPVSGKVTFSGGPCPAPGNVTFTPLEVSAGLPRRPAAGAFNTEGSFEVTSFRPGDGLLPGRYRVTVTCYSGLPNPTSPDPWGDVSYVQKGFEPPELIVEDGSDPIEMNLDVPLKQANTAATQRL
jgi:hypothetical protein